ncbi:MULTISPECIES: hypothetical protein [unclassified Chryseobacterium]|uniref:hypothetical protein n=1 Tax=unclassified Chryseobacterium TaxID=2593645 RepID=UPI00288333D5|nr:hypothetical protein [Chryseobacterium sp. SG20098]WNI38856.1 hypothetical protein RHP76_10250 [Chryseobacterium sp. SG20098]
MSRLTLEQFKKETVKNEKDVKELEKLTGGILGACHTTNTSGVKPFTDSLASGIKNGLKDMINSIWP